MVMPQPETITTTIKAARGDSPYYYRKEDSGWSIILTDKGKFLGEIDFEIKPGDVVQFEGSWRKSKFDGQQEFAFKAALLSVPEDLRSLLHLAVSWTKGLGEAKEDAIWEAYGPDWKDEQELSGITGITETTRFHWQDTLKRLDTAQAQVQAISFLMAKGCSLNMATVAWATWEGATVAKAQSNPYVLADLPHYGFSHVDNGIRQQFGIKDDDPRRLDAAVLYAISQVTGQGDTVAGWTDILEAVADMVPYGHERFDDAVKRLVEAGKLRLMPDSVGLEMMICRDEDWKDERSIWERFCAA